MRNPVQYKNVFIRDNFEDKGDKTDGILYASPDIIPCQDQLLGFARARETYRPGPDIGLPFLIDRVNNIYMRAYNLGDKRKQAYVQGYAAEASLLMSPSEWKDHPLKTDDGEESVWLVNQTGSADIGPAEVCLSQKAFALKLGAQGHQCVVGIVQALGNIIPVPDKFGSNGEFHEWIRTHPQAAFRNLIKERAAGDEFSAPCKFGNQSKTPQRMLFVVELYGAPEGAQLILQSTAKECPFRHEGLVPKQPAPGKPAVITLPPGGQTVPGHYSGTLRFTLRAKEKLPRFEFSLRYEQAKNTGAADEDFSLYEQFYEQFVADSTTGRTETALPLGAINYVINGD